MEFLTAAPALNPLIALERQDHKDKDYNNRDHNHHDSR
jgi:hypothetical protein